MNYLWKIVRNMMALVGAILIYLAASTSDLYLYELGELEPYYIKYMILWGIMLMIPAVLHKISEAIREVNENENL